VPLQPNTKRAGVDPWRLDALEVLMAVGGMLLLIGISRRFPGGYFAYSELITGYTGDVSFWGVLARFGIPFAACFVMAWRRDFTDREAMGSSLATALLLVWPTILRPEQALNEDLYPKRHLLYLIYLLFGVAFTYMGRAGASLGRRIQQSASLRAFVRQEVADRRQTIKAIIIGVASSALFALLQHLWQHQGP
jgi:hypothetical protein